MPALMPLRGKQMSHHRSNWKRYLKTKTASKFIDQDLADELERIEKRDLEQLVGDLETELEKRQQEKNFEKNDKLQGM